MTLKQEDDLWSIDDITAHFKAERRTVSAVLMPGTGTKGRANPSDPRRCVTGGETRTKRTTMQLDKKLHTAVGAAIMFVGSLLHPLIGLALCGIAAAAKEDYDRRHPAKHTSDGWDAYATMMGTIPGYALLLLWQLWMRLG